MTKNIKGKETTLKSRQLSNTDIKEKCYDIIVKILNNKRLKL